MKSLDPNMLKRITNQENLYSSGFIGSRLNTFFFRFGYLNVVHLFHFHFFLFIVHFKEGWGRGEKD